MGGRSWYRGTDRPCIIFVFWKRGKNEFCFSLFQKKEGRRGMDATVATLESLLLDGYDEAAQECLRKVSRNFLAQWEENSSIIKEGLERLSWWERTLSKEHPVTYQRL